MRRRFAWYGVALALIAAVAVLVHLVGVSRQAEGLPRPKPPTYVQSPLIAAILRRDAASVAILLKKGADPNVRYDRQSPGAIIPGISQLSHGPTPLMIAALGGDTGAYWDFYEYQGLEDHHGQWDDPVIVKDLLAHGADPNAQDEHGWTPLLCAAVNGNVRIAHCLLDHRADVNERLRGNETSLMDVAKRNDVPLVRLFLQRGADVNARNDDGFSPLIAACNVDAATNSPRYELGNAATAVLLLDHGADVNLPYRSQYPSQYPSALMVAVYNHNPAVVQVLLAHGAHVNATNSDGLTPLMLLPRIFSWRDQAIQQMLISNGARISAASYDGNTALTWAADKDDLRTVRFLLAHGADVNAVNRAGHTVLWFAANNGNAAMFNLLRSRGAMVLGPSGRGAVLPVWGGGLGNYNIYHFR